MGAGDSSRRGPAASLSFELNDTREAPHISHSSKDGWLLNVHLGHDNELPLVLDCKSAVGVLICSCWGKLFIGTESVISVELLLVAAAIVAFNTIVRGGLMPHARQGGSGVEAVAVAGSKLEGTGFEKEQIGQTHVAFTFWCVGGTLVEVPCVADEEITSWPIIRFCGLG